MIEIFREFGLVEEVSSDHRFVSVHITNGFKPSLKNLLMIYKIMMKLFPKYNKLIFLNARNNYFRLILEKECFFKKITNLRKN